VVAEALNAVLGPSMAKCTMARCVDDICVTRDQFPEVFGRY